MRFFKAILPNFTIALAISVVVIVIVHSHNPLMEFVTGTPFKLLCYLFCLSATATSIVLYSSWRRSCDNSDGSIKGGKHGKH